MYWSTSRVCVCVFTCHGHGDVQQRDSYCVVPNPLLHDPGEHQPAQKIGHFCGNHTNCRDGGRKTRHLLFRLVFLYNALESHFCFSITSCCAVWQKEIQDSRNCPDSNVVTEDLLVFSDLVKYENKTLAIFNLFFRVVDQAFANKGALCNSL